MPNSQYFIIFNIDKREYIARPWPCTFGNWMEKGNNLTSHLVQPIPLPRNPLEDVPLDSIVLSGQELDGAFFRVPAEIHGMIFAAIDDYYDACALALTNTYLWTVGVPYLANLYERHVQRTSINWAGDRLICLGNQTDTIPPFLFTAVERASFSDAARHICTDERIEIRRKHRQDTATHFTTKNYWWLDPDYVAARGGIDMSSYSRFMHNQASIFEDFQCLYRDVSDKCEEPHRWNRFVAEFHAINSGSSAHRFPGVIDWLRPANGIHSYPQTREPEIPYVLRNLTRRLYMRADTLARDPLATRGPFLRYFDFGDLIMSRICWSDKYSDSDFAHPKEGYGVLDGGWCGNRYDIVPFDSFDRDGWKDCTRQARKGLVEIWETGFGPEWKSKIDNRWKDV